MVPICVTSPTRRVSSLPSALRLVVLASLLQLALAMDHDRRALAANVLNGAEVMVGLTIAIVCVVHELVLAIAVTSAYNRSRPLLFRMMNETTSKRLY